MHSKELSDEIWLCVSEKEMFQIKEVKKELKEKEIKYGENYDSNTFSNAISRLIRQKKIKRKSEKRDGIYIVLKSENSEQKIDQLEQLRQSVLDSIRNQCVFLEEKLEEKKIADYVESEDSFSVLKDIVELLNYLKKFQFSK